MPREGTGMSWMSGQLHSPASLPPGRNPGTHFIGVLDCPKGGVTKLSHYRPGQVLRAAGRWDSQNFETVGTWRRSVLRTGRLYPQEEPLYSYLVVSRPQGQSAAGRKKLMKNPDDPSAIEPEIFRLVAHCLNQLHHRVPQSWYGAEKNLLSITGLEPRTVRPVV